ncbi:DNA-binding proteins Bright/BRCAA1/RBP1 and proteins containing BRIGHT domain [Acarospora aff. strigata]|nr:DNA-binding proteins Bright/BRCAA1/RBP1 and proteins containing BRIGHT domain [Acarospora aff. strigata]
MASVNNISSIAVAFAGKTGSVDIPKPRDGRFVNGRDSFAAVAARSLPTNKQPAMLPTPPNSISPSLPPHGFKAHGNVAAKAPFAPIHVDSDIDLQDAVDHAKSQDQPQHHFDPTDNLGSAAELDAMGAITPGLLAKHHLPDILLAHGPLAIRHVMGYLTTSVPGFSRIPPAKARRLVVGALEGRCSGGEGGGINGEVEFEKVGWGRWDAKLKGHPARDGNHSSQQRSLPLGNPLPPASVPSTSYRGVGVEIPDRGNRQTRNTIVQPATSTNGDSIVLSYDEEMEYTGDHEDITMLEHEADKMSLDGDESCSSSEAPDDGAVLDEDIGDVTDEEDWANIGAAALRQGSYPTATSGGGRNYNTHLSTRIYAKDRSGGGPASSALAKSMPMPSAYTSQQLHDYVGFAQMDGFGVGSDLQEREAVEALLRLSSV